MLRLQRKRRSRGAAYAEACVMIPVFIIIIWSYNLLYSANVARGTAMMNARSDAWEVSMEGCGMLDGGECRGDGCDEDGEVNSALSGDNSWILRILGGLFGPEVGGSSTVNYEVGTPSGANWGSREGGPLMSSGSASADIVVVCNTRRQTIWQILKQAICAVPGLGSFLDFISFC